MYSLNLFILFLHTCYICVCFQLVAFVWEHIWHKALFMGVLNEIWTHICFLYKWPLVGQAGLYRDCCSSFLECVYFGLLYPSLIFDMFIVMCVSVCVGIGVVWDFTYSFCVCVYLGEFCGFKFTRSSFSFIFCICIHVRVYVCVCVCMCLAFFFRLRICLA